MFPRDHYAFCRGCPTAERSASVGHRALKGEKSPGPSTLTWRLAWNCDTGRIRPSNDDLVGRRTVTLVETGMGVDGARGTLRRGCNPLPSRAASCSRGWS
jgi:hypothetical protein